MATLTPTQALAQFNALGIPLTARASNELPTLSDSELQQVVNDWIQVVQPPDQNTFLTNVTKIIQQVTPWIGVAVKIAAAFGLSIPAL
jgi:hypothetical protein